MNQIEQTITSLEVAEMMEVNHFEVLRKLEGGGKVKGIIPSLLTDNKIVVSDYFIESTYKDGSGKENKCYKITKLGCDFLANKFTGEKGNLFTARYVRKFHEMKEIISPPKSTMEILQLEFKAIQEVSDKVDSVNKDLQDFKQDLPMLGVDCDIITNAVRKLGVKCLGGKDSNAYKDRSIRGKVYSDIHGEIKRQFGVERYKEIKRSSLDNVLQIINEYRLPFVLEEEIKDCNSQLNIA